VKKPKKTKTPKVEILKTGTYIRVTGISPRSGVDDQLQAALIGMTLSVVSIDEPLLQEWRESFEQNFGTFEGYFVESDEIIRDLQSRGLYETVLFFKEEVSYQFLWFDPETCVEMKKEKLN
jgi:hypothetical protein